MATDQGHTGSGDNVSGNKTEVHHHYPEGYQKPIGLDTPKIQVSKLPYTSAHLIGRESELALLDQAWTNNQDNILSLKAMGGAGKTALMKTWLDNLAVEKFRGANAVYTWSFYSQGSTEDKQASADEFFDAALQWFGYHGDPLPSAHNKGLKLAELVNQQRTLLALDGLEPLQYPEGGAMDGALRDEGLKTLFKQLAAQNKGLLLISSRQKITELHDKSEPMVILYDLEPLSIAAGTALFKAAKITGTDRELAETVSKYNGHALSLNLLAKYLSEYENSDIRQCSYLCALTDFPETTRDTNHAIRVMAAYEKQLQGTPELNILFIMGLFDRPVSEGAIQYLRKRAIEHISDSGMNEKVFKAAIKRLRSQHLLNKEYPECADFDKKSTFDNHPLVREYFCKRLQERYPDSWQQAHRTLYEYYKTVTTKEQPDTLNEMEPLFAAVAHGCAAGLHQLALDEVYWPRIRRGEDNYICQKLGAFGADLSNISHFFDQNWHTPSAGLTDDWKGALLNWAAFRLRALGRLGEAMQPMQTAVNIAIEQKEWIDAATGAGILSEMQLVRGNISNSDNSALKVAEQGVQLADVSGDAFRCMTSRAKVADVQHQAGELSNARESFAEVEKLQQEINPDIPQLNSLSGFQYCDLLLTTCNWREVQQRAIRTLEQRKDSDSLLSIALYQLSLGQASLQQAITVAINSGTIRWISEALSKVIAHDALLFKVDGASLSTLSENPDLNKSLQTAKDWLNQAVDGMRVANREDYLPKSLLARTSYYRWCLAFTIPQDIDSASITGPLLVKDEALRDLQESHDIAQGGGMRLYLTDYHLESARLVLTLLFHPQPSQFFPGEKELKQQVVEHLQKAKHLIEDTGYKRRLPEVEYLEGMLLSADKP